MASLDVALITGKSSLQANQYRMNAIANNIANADKPGYHRQTAVTSSNTPLDRPNGQIGTGVHVESVVRSYDLALENSLRQAIQQDGRNQVFASKLSLLETAMAADGSLPLTDALGSFATGLQDLAAQPESIEKRSEVLGQATAVADRFNELTDIVTGLRDVISGPADTGILADQVEAANNLGTQIAALNEKISAIETRRFNPMPANDLRDERDAMVADLARLSNITVRELADKTYQINIGDRGIVDGAAVTPLTVSTAGGTPSIQWSDDNTPVDIADGELTGLIQAWEFHENVRASLTGFATELSTQVNAVHNAGFSLDGNQGGDLFALDNEGRLTIAISNPSDLAASTEAGATGNGENITAVWDRLHASNPALGDATIRAFPDTILNSVARDVNQAGITADGSAAAVVMFREAVNDVSAVNIDEEMVQMLEVQRSYQATARFISILDNMFNSVLGILQ